MSTFILCSRKAQQYKISADSIKPLFGINYTYDYALQVLHI